MGRRAGGLDHIALLILLAIVGLRPLIQETHDSSLPVFGPVLTSIQPPGPVFTLSINLAIGLAAVLWSVSRRLKRESTWRSTGLGVATLIMAVAAAGSLRSAGNLRLAVNAGVDWLMLPVMAIVLTQLLDTPWKRRLTLAVVVASGATAAMECVNQYYFTFDQTVQLYEQNKAEIWARQGIDPDSDQVQLYEKRLYGREVASYLTHTNIAAAYLAAVFFALVGLIIDRRRGADGGPRWWSMALLAILLILVGWGIVLTNSRGGMMMAPLGFMFFAVVSLLARLKAPRPALFASGWVLALVLAGTLAWWAQQRGGFPERSLDFRWKYWTASARMAADHPLFGVGAENFGRHYTRYKGIESPEEISDPHNFFVAVACEWGLAGLAGALLMALGVSYRLTCAGPDPAPVPGNAPGSSSPGRSCLLWALLIAAPLFGARVFALGSSDQSYLYVETAIPGFVWCVCFVLALLDRPGSALGSRAFAVAGRRMILCGILAFFAHDMISFGLRHPGAATTIMGLLAFALSSRETTALSGARARVVNRTLAVGSVGFSIAFIIWALVPVGRAGKWLGVARRAAPSPDVVLNRQPAELAYQQAEAADPRDPQIVLEHAQWAASYSQWTDQPVGAVNHAIALARRAVDRDPYAIGAHRLLAGLLMSRGLLTHSAEDLDESIRSTENAIALYPTLPQEHVRLADAWLALGQLTHDRSAYVRASEAYQRALDLDDARPIDEIRRLAPTIRLEIENKRAEAAGNAILRDPPQ